MAVIRVNKTKDYTVMSNYHIKDQRLSLKAKGLLSLMLSLPDEWDYSVAGLVAICIENDTAINSTLKELKKCGYLKVTKKMPNQTASGRIEYEYDIYEKPLETQDIEKQGVENLGLVFQGVENQAVENQAVENQGQLSTNVLSTEKESTKVLSTEKKKKASKSTFDAIIAEYAKDNEELKELLGEWLKVRKAKRAAMTDKAIQMNIDKLDKLAVESNMSVPEYIKEVICRGWAAFFVINNYSKPENKGMTKGAQAYNSYPQRQRNQHEYDALEAMLLKQQNPPKTAGTDESIRARAEALKQQLS